MGSDRARLALLCVAQFIDVLGVTVAVVALPSIGHDLGGGTQAQSWVLSAYALCFGGLLIPAGRAGDRLGSRRLFLGGLLGFAAASALAGLAPGMALLIAGRALQGVAAAVVVPSALALLTEAFPEGPRRTRALAVWTAAAACGGVAGFALGGLITGAAGWRWVFLFNVPVALTAAALAPRLLEERARAKAAGGLARAARTIAGPCAIAATLTATTSGAALLITNQLQDVEHHGPIAAGLLFAPFSLGVVAGSMLLPKEPPRRGMLLGLVLVAAGMLTLPLSLVAGMVLAGAGLGWASVAATERAMTTARSEDRGAAAGLVNTAAQLGTAVGVAVIGAVAAGHGNRTGWFVAAAAAAAAGLTLSLTAQRAQEGRGRVLERRQRLAHRREP
jgi:MFS family permease